MNEKELIEKRNDLQSKMEGILNTAKVENREMNEEEIGTLDQVQLLQRKLQSYGYLR